MDQSAWIEEFRSEAIENLESVDAQLLVLERTPYDPQVIRKMFVAVHTIKGNAALVGLGTTQELSHAVEDVLGWLRDQQRPADRETINVLFRAVDALRGLVVAARAGVPEPTMGISELIAELRACTREPALGQDGVRDATVLPLTALLVEDSPTVRLLEQHALIDAGFEVDALADGHEALHRFQQSPYDLVVTSIELRGMNGLDLVAALRASPSSSSVPVILMTSSDDPEQRTRALALEVDHYILKGPASRDLLHDAARGLRARRPT